MTEFSRESRGARCTAADCDRPAAKVIEIEDTGGHPYCDQCAEVLLRGGHREITRETVPASELPALVLLCRHHDCYGAFYFPLDLDEHIACPNDSTHPVVVYGNPRFHDDRPEL